MRDVTVVLKYDHEHDTPSSIAFLGYEGLFCCQCSREK
jgi:hypothetical protein